MVQSEGMFQMRTMFYLEKNLSTTLTRKFNNKFKISEIN